MQATNLTPSTQTSAYQVWLYDSPSKRKSLGATATDTSGNLSVAGNLPADYQQWKYIDVTSVTISGSGNEQEGEHRAVDPARPAQARRQADRDRQRSEQGDGAGPDPAGAASQLGG